MVKLTYKTSTQPFHQTQGKQMIADLVTNAQEAAHAAISNGWDILEQASLFFRKLPYLIPDALNEFNRNILGF